MTRDRRLGRGLAALLGNPAESDGGSPGGPSGAVTIPSAEDAGRGGCEPKSIPIALIDPNPQQPRREFEESELRALADSLQEHQLLQPVLLRKVGERFELISGERRWRAATLAGWDTIPAIVRDADDRASAEWALVENLQRKDLGPIEKARSFQHYLKQHGGTQEELARRLQIDRSTVANLLRLLELPHAVQQLIQQSQLAAGHARALLPLADSNLQEQFARRAVAESWSVRETERQVQQRLRGTKSGGIANLEKRANQLGKRGPSRHLESMERELKQALGAQVEIRANSKQAGKIVIHFGNGEEFERLRSLLLDGRLQTDAA